MMKNMNIPKTMHALVLHDVGKLMYEEIDNYKLKKDFVLVKIKFCGICSSDIERVFVTGTYHFPTIPGHEIAGEIVSVNDEDKDLLGKKVCVFPMIPCMKCEFCKNEKYAQCSNYNYFGSRCDGGYSEYLLVPKWNLVFVDDSIDVKLASLCEPASVSLHAAKILELRKGQKVAISGTGTIAVLIGFFLNKMGAIVTIVGRNNDKLKIISEMGFDTLDVENIEEYRCKFDYVVEAVGSNNSINQSIDLVDTYGKVVLVGNPKENVLIDKNIYWKILRKQLIVTGSWNSSYSSVDNDWVEVLNYMKEYPDFFSNLITNEFSLKDVDKAFEYLMNKDYLKFKVVFKID